MNSGTKTTLLRERIYRLRYKHKSYKEISKSLGISKSTVSYWIATDPKSQTIKRELTRENLAVSRRQMKKIAMAAKKRWNRWREEAKKEAVRSFDKLLSNPLFVAGLMIYWGEGDSKPQNPLRVSNTDPRMINLYVKFLLDVLKLSPEKIRLALTLYPDLEDEGCKKFWASVTGLTLKNFIKTQYIRGYHPTKRLKHGICVVIVNSRQVKEKILTWIDLFAKKTTIMR